MCRIFVISSRDFVMVAIYTSGSVFSYRTYVVKGMIEIFISVTPLGQSRNFYIESLSHKANAKLDWAILKLQKNQSYMGKKSY